jgi:hypothetical protein
MLRPKFLKVIIIRLVFIIIILDLKQNIRKYTQRKVKKCGLLPTKTYPFLFASANHMPATNSAAHHN